MAVVATIKLLQRGAVYDLCLTRAAGTMQVAYDSHKQKMYCLNQPLQTCFHSKVVKATYNNFQKMLATLL